MHWGTADMLHLTTSISTPRENNNNNNHHHLKLFKYWIRKSTNKPKELQQRRMVSQCPQGRCMFLIREGHLFIFWPWFTSLRVISSSVHVSKERRNCEIVNNLLVYKCTAGSSSWLTSVGSKKKKVMHTCIALLGSGTLKQEETGVFLSVPNH